MNRSTCLLCFAVNVATYSIKYTRLHDVFDELSDIKAEYRPLVLLTAVKVLDTPIPYNSVTIKQVQEVIETHTQCLNIDAEIESKRFEIKEEHATTSTPANHQMGHNIGHTGGKPHICDICDMTFRQKSSLNVHKRIHTGLKPYSCDICNKTFISNSNLNKHKRAHNGDKPFSCDTCNKPFRYRSSLNRHKLIQTGDKLTHTDGKAHSCDICIMTFRQKSSLNAHKRIHTGLKLYSCDICNKTFISSSKLNEHKRTHNGGKPHSCDICNMTFNHRNALLDILSQM